MAVAPGEESRDVLVIRGGGGGGGLPEDGVGPVVWLGLEDELEPLLKGLWSFLG